jgi:FKBP-type peptidyl-prolyl cis-trans isomerase
MNVGSKYRFYIPYQLAYGMNDQGPIPGGSVLVFDVELLNVKQASAMK